MPKTKIDPFEQPRWIAFKDALERRGYGLKALWHASDNITIWAVYVREEGKPAPHYTTVVTRHYEKGNGFSVWLESRTGKIEEGAVEIITGNPADFVASNEPPRPTEESLAGGGA